MTLNQKICYDIINCIPSGKVAYYGQVNQIIGMTHAIRLTPQVVGFILTSLPEDKYDIIMWQRVVAISGHIPALKIGFRGNLQIKLLKDEGIDFVDNTIDMSKYCIDTLELLNLYKKTINDD